MTSGWIRLRRKDGRAIESAWRLQRRLAARGCKALSGLMISATIVGLIVAANAVADLVLAPSAFAEGHAAHGNHGNGASNGNGNGNGNADRGLDQDGTGFSAADPLNDNGVEPPGQEKRDGDDAVDKWVNGVKIDLGIPISEQIELGKNNNDLSEYLGKIDYPGKIAAPDHPSAKAGPEPKGKAIGLRRKGKLDDAGVPSAKESVQRSNRLAIDPRFYSPREVLAINLSSAPIAHLRRLGFSIGASTGLGEDAVTILTLPTGMDALDAIDLLDAELPGERFQLNHLYRLYHPAVKEDVDKGQRTQAASLNAATKCLDDRCYAESAIGWRDDFAACAVGVRVGVVDTDVDFGHPTFQGQKITHKSFLPHGRSPSPNWHGTGVLALLAGRPDSGTPGLINQADFFVASVFFAGEDGQPVTDTVSLLKALDWMDASGARLVNMSLTGTDDELVRARIASLGRQGFVFTAAAGNEGPAAGPSYPAAYPEVIAVTAITKQLQIFPFANRGAYIDLAAPGVHIWTAVPETREGYRSGTSFAAPFATALLAIQQPAVLRLPKEGLLDHVKTVTLGAGNHNPTYGRGLLQAPAECPTAAATVADWAPVLDPTVH